MSKYDEALKQLGDISYFINETYSDNEPLEENQRDSRQCFMNYCKNIKQALLKAQEQEKALKIIIDKCVEMTLLLYSFIVSEDVGFYNLRISGRLTKALTQEEYDTLKRGI